MPLRREQIYFIKNNLSHKFFISGDERELKMFVFLNSSLHADVHIEVKKKSKLLFHPIHACSHTQTHTHMQSNLMVNSFLPPSGLAFPKLTQELQQVGFGTRSSHPDC